MSHTERPPLDAAKVEAYLTSIIESYRRRMDGEDLAPLGRERVRKTVQDLTTIREYTLTLTSDTATATATALRREDVVNLREVTDKLRYVNGYLKGAARAAGGATKKDAREYLSAEITRIRLVVVDCLEALTGEEHRIER